MGKNKVIIRMIFLFVSVLIISLIISLISATISSIPYYYNIKFNLLNVSLQLRPASIKIALLLSDIKKQLPEDPEPKAHTLICFFINWSLKIFWYGLLQTRLKPSNCLNMGFS